MFERGLTGTVIIDCLTLYLSNLLLDGWDDEEIRREVKDIIHQIKDGDADCIVVSNEVGMGIVPETYLGRRFRDLAGRANQMLAGEADEVYLIAAGIPLKIKGKGD
ncbi:MAG TPA: hypothetical protein EYP53_04005 [Candidatus Latescibacteria bacterium]|nr:hypothetical protein [Candidatus Latescibacterota bacterium]